MHLDKQKLRDSLVLVLVMVAVLASFAVMLIPCKAAAQQTADNSTTIDGINQRNQSAVTSSGSYTQNVIGQGSGNFDQGSIPTYERKGDVQCAVSSMSADAFALNNDASIGAFRLGISVPLTFGYMNH